MQEHEPETTGLRWLKSPIAQDASVGAHIDAVDVLESNKLPTPSFESERRHHGPEFQRHDEATSAELFFDLFFAANLTVFSEVHEVSTRARLVGYIGFFCLMWFTWALVGLFDVRFVADSVFSRVARAGHLGVMIGFAVVAGDFHPEEQDERTFQTMSVCLMASRLILSVQYAAVAWHVRGYERAKRPLAAMAVVHLACAVVYLGLAFCLGEHNSHVYVAWLALAALETFLNVGLSLASDVLSFRGTHLVNRMILLTFIIIGEGVVVICHSVTNIVVNSNSWTPATIGSVASAVGTVYFVWMLYDDWQPLSHLGSCRQLLWSCVHFPFHLTLVLFVGGSAQFIVWFKIIESLQSLPSYAFVNPSDNSMAFTTTGNVTKSGLIQSMGQIVHEIFEMFPPKNYVTLFDLNWAEGSLNNLSDAFWGNITNPQEQSGQLNPEEVNTFVQALTTLDNLVVNSLFETFQIDALNEIEYTNASEFEQAVYHANTDRFEMVLIYAFVSAGAVLVLMSLLLIIRRARQGWGRLSIAQMVANIAIGLGLALSALITLNDPATSNFMISPWVLPTLCLTFFFVLVLNHLPRSPPSFPKLGGRLGAKTGRTSAGPERRRRPA